MTPGDESPRHRPDRGFPTSDRDALVDLLASCSLDGVEADRDDRDAAHLAGIATDEVERRRIEFAALRDGLLGASEAAESSLETAANDFSQRRRERSIATAIALGSTGSEQDRDNVTTSGGSARRALQRRLAPVLVAAGVVAIAGIGALAVFDGDESEDTASSGVEVQLDAADDPADAGPTTTTPLPSPAEAAEETADASTTDSAQAYRATAAAIVVDLGSLDNLNLAFDALRAGGAASSSTARLDADTQCVVQMTIEGYRAVATVRVDPSNYLLGESNDGEFAAFRSSDCTVVARRTS